MKHRCLFFKIVIALILFSLSFSADAQTPDVNGIVYVTHNGTGDGSSWGSPTSNLHNAINAPEVKMVFVAVGTYKVGGTSFVMKNGVKIYGGFNPGGGITDLSHNRVLPNKGMGDGSILDGQSARPVIWNDMPERGRGPMDSTAVLDGFTITKGAYSSHGAGIRNINASPVLRNLVIKKNTTSYPGQGAGIYNYNSSPSIINVSVAENYASLNGGGIYNDMGSSPVMTHVSITANEAAYQGGGLYNDMNCNPRLINVKVTDNQSYRGTSDAGGGIFHAYGTSTYINVTFANNFPVDVRLYDGSILFSNSIVAGGLRRGPSATYTAHYSLINGNTDVSNGNINAAGYSAAQIFNAPSTGDYTLKDSSPAVDAGSNELFPGLDANTPDLAGNSRVHNYASHGVIDMGAYESPFKAPILPDANGIVYVTRSGGGNGSSWARPTSDLQGAINATGTQKVFVATGTYKAPYGGFKMKSDVEIYGGFDPGNGIRDLSHNRILPSITVEGSVLDGEEATQVIVNYGNNLTASAVLDGFKITRGNVTASWSGGGIYNKDVSPTLRNLVITRNEVIDNGGGIYNENSSPVLTNVIISNNLAGGRGAGIYNVMNSRPELHNVLISWNYSYQGSALSNLDNSHAKLVNTTLANNGGDYNVFAESGGGFDFYNSVIYGSVNAPYNSYNSLIEGQSVTANGNMDATGISLTDIFTDPSTEDYTLKINSPPINAGNNSYFAGLNASTKDLAGNARVYRYDNGGVIDLGAYESPYSSLAPLNGIIYVKNEASGERDGTSWDNATDNLHKAIHTHGVQKVFVAVGEYKVGASSFVMKNGVEIYGGFDPGSGITDLSHNRIMPDASNTQGSVLNGEGVRPVIWNVFTSGTAMDATAVLDGFTVFNGSHTDGAGIRNIYASPTLRNLVIRGNRASVSGAGILNNYSSPSIRNTVISDNTVTHTTNNVSGAGVFNNNNSAPTLVNTTITGNKLVTSTGGMYGAGIFNGGGSAAKVYNSIIWDNRKNGNATAAGADIETIDAGLTLKNSITQLYTTGNPDDKNKAGADPLFAHAGFSLQGGSPALGKGDNALFEGLDGNTKDLAGNPRLSGLYMDMGAYELLLMPDANSIIYVKPVASGEGNGSSWDHATGNLHNAIHVNGVQKVFVAVGTYTTGDYSFIMKENVEIYGGFDPGSGITGLSHPRILPNKGMGDGSVLDGEDTRPVIWNNYSGLTSAALLDGFTITRGKDEKGAGIFNVAVSPTLRNLVIKNNRAWSDLFSAGSTPQGGGIYNFMSSPVITNVHFLNNLSKGSYQPKGGGMYNDFSSPVLQNVLFSGNAANYGSAICNDRESHVSLVNVTIAGNNLTNAHRDAIYSFSDASTSLKNSIIYDGPLEGAGTYTLEHSLVENNTQTSNGNLDATGITASHIFTHPSSGDYTLKNGSPAIDAGSNVLFLGLNENTEDIAGNARIFNYTEGGIIDLGAYESAFSGAVAPDTSGIVYVREGFTGTGRTWGNATGDLKAAIEAAGTQKVFVATGNYDAPANGSFKLKNQVEIYGGFDPDNGIRTLADNRILPTETVSGSVLNGQNVRGVIRNDYTSANPIDNSAILDGFTITNGSTAGNTFGAGVLNVFSSPVLRNLVIKNNRLVAGGGAGMANVSASPVVSNVIITGNEALRGGGVYNVDDSRPEFTDVIISYNKATSDNQLGGGGIFSLRSSPKLTRVTISHNTAGNAGGGIYAVNSSSIVASHSIIENNTAPYGGGVYFNASSSQFDNGIFRGNSATMATAGSGGGAIFNQNSDLLLTNVAVTGNSTNFQGGGLRSLSGNPVLTNVTFAGNTAVNTANTAIDIAGGAPELHNTLVFGTVTGNYTALYSLIQGNTDFTNGNIDASAITPVNVFTDPANGDYTLPACSPAVNSGSNSLFPGLDISKVDLAGNPRVYDFANGKTIDMGAYELQGAPADYSAMTFESDTVVYNGNPHAITVQNVLLGASVAYEITDSGNQTTQGNAATGAGTYKITATITPAGNCLPIKRTATLKINKAAAVITAAQTQKHVYDGAVKNVIASLNHTENPINYSPQRGYTVAGTYPVIISASETANYLAASDTVSLVIEKAKLSGITFRDSTFTYDGTTKSLAVSGLPDEAAVAYDGNGKINAGIYTVKATVSRPNYQDSLLTATLTISKAAAVITAAQTQRHVYDATVKNVVATLNHTEAPLTYSPQQGYTAIGSYPVIVSAATTANYLATSDTVNLVIEKANLSGITFRDSTFTYDGTPKSLAVAGLPADATVTYSGNAKTNAGIYSVNATVSRPNYQDSLLAATLTIHKALAVITATPTQKHVYDGAAKNVLATLSHSETTLTYSPQQGYTAVGTYPVIISAAETGNYLKAADTVNLVIEKASLSGITFRDSTFTYDGTPKSLAVSGLPADATVTYSGNAKTNAGIYSVNATVSRPNYQDSLLTASLTIRKAAAVITAAQTQKHMFDGAVKNVAATLNHTETTLSYSPQQGYTAVGTYPVIISAAETGNYLKAADTVNLVIEKATLSGIALRDSAFTYDGTPKSLAVAGLPADATVTYTGNAKTGAGIYTVTAIISRQHYQDSALSATLTIHKAVAIITAAQTQNHVYDGTVKNVSALLNHAETALTYSPLQGYTDAGTYPVIISAAETGNYLPATETVNLVIGKANLSGITFPDSTFTYDGTPKSLAVAGLPADATVIYSGNAKTDAGIYTVTATVSRQQYQDSVLSATLTIHKAATVITASAEQAHIADGSVKNVWASLNHQEASLNYSPQQGYAQPGNYEITVSVPESKNYLGASQKVKLVIDKATFQGVGFPDGQFTYNGTAHYLYVWGAPEGAQITYSGNGQTNAGSYWVKALVQKENYHDLELTALMIIYKAPAYISAEAVQSHVYDGSVKNVQAWISHSETSPQYLPQQGYTDAGSYYITVVAHETPNYFSASATVHLYIDKARFQDVSLAGKEFTYSGSPYSLTVTGAPEGATVTYAGNHQTNAGKYKVTALVQMKNYYDLELEAELTIHKAPQAISFEEIGIKHLENDPDFRLAATSSSGLPVSYSYTYNAEVPPATVTAEGWVELHTSGYVNITAHQQGNENYLPAEPVSRQLKINSSDATIHRITIGTETFETPEAEIYYLVDCADGADQIPVQFNTEVGAYVTPGRSFTLEIPQPGIYKQTVVITSQDSTRVLTYHIIVEKRFRFEDIGIQKFNNLFLVNNNPQTNGGYEFVEYEWYKNGEIVGSGQYYSAGGQVNDILDREASYSVRMKTTAGEWLSSCSFGFRPDESFSMDIFPNPVLVGDLLKIKVSDPAEAKVRILTVTGAQVLETFLKGNPAEVKLPSDLPAGSYILHYDNGKHRKSIPFVLKK